MSYNAGLSIEEARVQIPFAEVFGNVDIFVLSTQLYNFLPWWKNVRTNSLRTVIAVCLNDSQGSCVIGNKVTDLNIGQREVTLFLCQVASFTRSLSPSRSVTRTATRSKRGSTTCSVWTRPLSSPCRQGVRCRLPASCTTSTVIRSSRITKRPRCFFNASCLSTCRRITR